MRPGSPARTSAREAPPSRQNEELVKLATAAENGTLLDFKGVLIIVDQVLVQDLLRAVTPLEADVGSGFHVKIDSANASFGDGVALVSMTGTARWRRPGGIAGHGSGGDRRRRAPPGRHPQCRVAASWASTCRTPGPWAATIRSAGSPRRSPAGSRCSSARSRSRSASKTACRSRRWSRSACRSRPRTSRSRSPCSRSRHSAAGSGSSWMPLSHPAQRSSRRRVERLLAARPRVGDVGARGLRHEGPAGRSGADGVAEGHVRPSPRAARKGGRHRAHRWLSPCRPWTGRAGDPLGLIEELAGNVARHYLDRVTVDLSEIEGHSSGSLRKKTLFGRVKVGEWSVSVDLGDLTVIISRGLAARLAARPRHGRRRAAGGRPGDRGKRDAPLRLGLAGLANVVCRDFELTREICGRVLAQRHLVMGALRLHNDGESLTATPVFPDRRIRLKLDLTARSWGVVEAALRSQDSSGSAAR